MNVAVCAHKYGGISGYICNCVPNVIVFVVMFVAAFFVVPLLLVSYTVGYKAVVLIGFVQDVWRDGKCQHNIQTPAGHGLSDPTPSLVPARAT